MRTPIHCAAVLILLVVAIGCDRKPEAVLTSATRTEDLALLTREGCVNTATLRENLDVALRSLRLPTAYQVIDLDTLKETDARGGYPTRPVRPSGTANTALSRDVTVLSGRSSVLSGD